MRILQLLAAVWIAASIGCASVSYPAITSSPTDTYRQGDVVWHDLVTTNPGAVTKFYSDLFGWDIDMVVDADVDYYTIKNNGNLIGGIMYPEGRTEDKGSEWLTMISVASVPDAVSQVQTHGGKVYGENYAIEGRGDVALVTDPAMAFLGLIRSATGDPEATDPGDGDWLWTELWTDDPAAAMPFYERFGIEFEQEEKSGNSYYLMKSGDEVVASMIQNPIENWRSQWIPYIRVANAREMAEKAAEVGGKVVSPPSPEVRDGKVAVVMDPGGALFVLQEWSK